MLFELHSGWYGNSLGLAYSFKSKNDLITAAIVSPLACLVSLRALLSFSSFPVGLLLLMSELTIVNDNVAGLLSFHFNKANFNYGRGKMRSLLIVSQGSRKS